MTPPESPKPSPPISATRRPRRVEVGQAVCAGVLGTDVVHDPHPLDDVAGGAADVDRLAAGARRGSALDDVQVDSVSAQPVRQCEAGDAGAGDEYVHAYNVQPLAYDVQRTSAARGRRAACRR